MCQSFKLDSIFQLLYLKLIPLLHFPHLLLDFLIGRCHLYKAVLARQIWPFLLARKHSAFKSLGIHFDKLAASSVTVEEFLLWCAPTIERVGELAFLSRLCDSVAVLYGFTG